MSGERICMLWEQFCACALPVLAYASEANIKDVCMFAMSRMYIVPTKIIYPFDLSSATLVKVNIESSNFRGSCELSNVAGNCLYFSF